MKKSSLSKNLISFFIVLAVILLLIFFNLKGWLSIPKNLVYFVSSPFLKIFQWSGKEISQGFTILFTIKDLSRENAALKAENQKLWKENSQLKEVAQENEILRQRFSLAEPDVHQLVLANIVGYSPQPGQYFLIDKGSVNGLVPGMTIITANNFLVGKVVEAQETWAKVILISDSSLAVNAITQESRANGVVRGSHGLELVMEMVPADQKIKEGETVLTSGLNDFIPKGLIIGRISEIILKESEIFQKANVQPAVDFKKLESVFVIVK